MIESVRKGDLLAAGAQTLVNTVNTVGVMGKGIALEFKRRFPEMYKDYEARCAAGEVRLGEPYLYRTLLPPWIINFPTKGHWRAVSRLSDIEAGLTYLADHLVEWEVESLAVPPLGCGNGQLEWSVVGPTIYRHLDRLPIPVVLYAPFTASEEESTLEFLASAESSPSARGAEFIRTSWLAIAAAAARINDESHSWPIGRTRFQKLAYFAQAAGIDAGLEFNEGSYGPFSDDVKPMLTRLVNNGVLEETKTGRMLRLTPGPAFGDAESRFRSDIEDNERAIERVADLMARLDTDSTEVAASVHFTWNALRSEQADLPTEADVLKRLLQWKRRRKPALSAEVVAASIRDLTMLGWIDVAPSPDFPVDDDLLTVA